MVNAYQMKIFLIIAIQFVEDFTAHHKVLWHHLEEVGHDDEHDEESEGQDQDGGETSLKQDNNNTFVIFTESAPRPIQSISRNFRPSVFLSVCLFPPAPCNCVYALTVRVNANHKKLWSFIPDRANRLVWQDINC